MLMHCAGPQALAAPPEAVAQETLDPSAELQMLGANYLDWRKTTIYGGTTEVQKNLIAKAILA